MKLVKFQCTVAVNRAKEKGEDVKKSHSMWINPDDVQMVAPQERNHPERVSIFFRKEGGTTSVEGTFEEVIEKLTTA